MTPPGVMKQALPPFERTIAHYSMPRCAQVHRLEEFWRMFESFEMEHLEKLYPNPRQPGDDKAASQQHLRDVSAKVPCAINLQSVEMVPGQKV